MCACVCVYINNYMYTHICVCISISIYLHFYIYPHMFLLKILWHYLSMYLCMCQHVLICMSVWINSI